MAIEKNIEKYDQMTENETRTLMKGYLKVYPGVKTINVVTMLLVEFVGMLALAWWSASMIFYFQT